MSLEELKISGYKSETLDYSEIMSIGGNLTPLFILDTIGY